MALVAATVALIFAVDVPAVQLVAAAVGGVTTFMALAAVPDIVIGVGQPDLSEDSLKRYLKKRQRQTQVALLWLVSIATVGASGAFGFVIAELSHDPLVGVASGLGGVLGGAIGGAATRESRESLWPRDIRRD